jgi:hypothetical protein
MREIGRELDSTKSAHYLAKCEGPPAPRR